jgi:hypothetical protein
LSYEDEDGYLVETEQVCELGHSEIIYYTQECPLCNAYKQLHYKIEELKQLEDKIRALMEKLNANSK